jgi:hypothetical protein
MKTSCIGTKETPHIIKSLVKTLGVLTVFIMVVLGVDKGSATPIARWTMTPTGGLNPAVLDQDTAGGGIYDLTIVDDLGIYPTINDVPPPGMFVNGNYQGDYSFDVEALENYNGTLYYCESCYGDEFEFTSSFSVEMFFKSDGDMSGVGQMELLHMGDSTYLYSLDINQAAPGSASFTLVGNTTTNTVTLSDRNYADGQWHYVLAVFDASAGSFGALKLTVANQDGTDTNTSVPLSATYTNSTTAAGNMIIGKALSANVAGTDPLEGFIGEMQLSSGVVVSTNRIGRIPSVDGPAPSTFPATIVQNPLPVSVVVGEPAQLSAQAIGDAPLTYYWRLNGTPISGATNLIYSIFPVTTNIAGSYDFVATNNYGMATSTVATVTALSPTRTALWPMNGTGQQYPVVLDVLPNGSETGPIELVMIPWPINCFTNIVPPINMFLGIDYSFNSYNSSAISNSDGCLLYEFQTAGQVFSYQGAFSVEIFFQSSGDQSSAGKMQLVYQSEANNRYNLTLNQSASGGLQFAVNGGTGIQSVNLTDRNYADGQWHYVLAVYDTLNGTNGALEITAVNPDGSESSATNALPSGFGPLAPADLDTQLFLGRHTYALDADPATFLGLINEVQITTGVVQPGQRIGRIPSQDGPLPATVAPYFVQPPPTNSIGVSGGFLNLSPLVQGSSLSYQWFDNGQPIPNQTNASLSLSDIPVTASGSFTLVVTNSANSVTSSVDNVLIHYPFPIALWEMQSQIRAPNAQGVPSYNGIANSATNLNDGVSLGVGIYNDLITFNDLPEGPVTLTNIVPPALMYVNGYNGGTNSYDAEAIANVNGGLFFLPSVYGDVMDFTGPFSIELFFKSDGDQSGSGLMELISQGTDGGQVFRYGVDVNGSGPGAVTFTLANSVLGETYAAGLTGANYADGQWHYLLAVCDSLSGTNGQMRLTIVNQDGSQATTTTNLPAGFLPLPAVDNGAMYVGRYFYTVTSTAPRPGTFLGFMDDVQVTEGVVTPSLRVGKVPTMVPSVAININRMAIVAGNVQIDFTAGTGDTPGEFVVQSASSLSGAGFADLATATITQLSPGQFRAVTPVNGAAHFYRMRSL